MRRRLHRRALRWFFDWVGRAPDRRLRRLMAGRLGGRIIDTVKRAMENRLDSERARDTEAVVEFWITGLRDRRSEKWQLLIDAGRCRALDELSHEPDLTVEVDCVRFLKLVTGNASGPTLFLTGDLKLHGDLMLAANLPRLFRRPRR